MMGAHTDCKEKANESDGYNCYNEFMKEGIWANLLITCDFLGSLEKKRIFTTVSQTLKIKDFGNIDYTGRRQKCYGRTQEGA